MVTKSSGTTAGADILGGDRICEGVGHALEVIHCQISELVPPQSASKKNGE